MNDMTKSSFKTKLSLKQTAFNAKISKIVEECRSIEEAKMKLAVNNISYSASEYGFVKWFYNLIHGTNRNDPALDGKGHDRLLSRMDKWDRLFHKYILKNIDQIIDEQKFRNLLNSHLAEIANYDKIAETSFKRSIRLLKLNKKSRYQQYVKERSKQCWASHDKIKLTPLSFLLLKAYYRKHGLHFS